MTEPTDFLPYREPWYGKALSLIAAGVVIFVIWCIWALVPFLQPRLFTRPDPHIVITSEKLSAGLADGSIMQVNADQIRLSLDYYKDWCAVPFLLRPLVGRPHNVVIEFRRTEDSELLASQETACASVT